MGGMAVRARYDGHADWYDARYRRYGDEQGSAGLLARLLGPADPDDPVCVDVGCGTGLHFRAVRQRGYTVVGIDLSADQLRLAASRGPHVLRADAGRLPLADSSVPTAVMTFIHTDVDDFAAVVGEAARVLRSGGRLVYLGPHPAYVSGFVDRGTETDDREVRIGAGYGDERRQHDPTGRFPIRSHVGARYLTMTTFLGAFLAQPTLRLAGVQELDTRMQPWQPGSADGRVVPWHIAITAQAV